MTFYKRTISIRKTVHFADGLVSPAQGEAYGASIMARDISCTITVDVPVLTDVPERSERYEIVGYLREHDFQPDDEISIEAHALPERCPFRKCTGAVVYHRAAHRLCEMLDSHADGHVLGLDAEGGYTLVEGDTPAVVRVRDIFPEYEPAEDK